jgi:hypothetical protein
MKMFVSDSIALQIKAKAVYWIAFKILVSAVRSLPGGALGSTKISTEQFLDV